MVPSFSSNLFASCFIFAEHRLLQYAAAFQPVQTKFYYSPDPVLPTGYLSYASPWRQFVYDSGVSGAAIINVVSGGSTVYNRASGIHIDYDNGRVIVPASFGTALTLTGYASFKEVNFYQSNETEETVLTQAQFFLNPRYKTAPISGLQPYLIATPGIFVNTLGAHNEAYQFGGMVNSKVTVSMVALAQSQFQLRDIFSIFMDCRYQYIPMINTVNDVLDGFGDVKGGTGHNYLTLCGTWGAPGNLIYIENVRMSKVSDRLPLNPGQVAGIIDMDVSYVRQSPVSTNVFV